jgi:flagellar motor switch protein FliN/FliY
MDALSHESPSTANPSGEKSAIVPCVSGPSGPEDSEETPGVAAGRRDQRLDRLPMQLDVILKVKTFRVEDLLAMEKGTVVETSHEHSQDVPVRCGGALLVWAEFEVLEQKLAVRVTRLA